MSTPVIDADGHILEQEEQLARYLDWPYREPGRGWTFYPRDGWNRRLGGRLGQWADSAESWLRALDEGGVDTTVLFPTSGLFIGFVKDPDWAIALCRAYNTFLYEEVLKVSPRLQAVALLPVQAPHEAVAELRRAVKELGFVGGMLAADGPHLLGQVQFVPIYEEAQRLDTMLAVHASGSHLGGGGVDLYPKFIQAHTVSHPFGQMRQLTSIVFEGIPERFPHLRLAFLEAGVGWVPYWMGRMDEEYDKRGDVDAPGLKKSPSEYVKSGNLYFSCEADEPLLPEALRLVGEDVVVYASDYPHWDNEFPGSIRVLKERKDITDKQAGKILADNARRLYWSSSGGR